MDSNNKQINMDINCNPKVSIIIPAYNSEQTIERCINSVVTQDYMQIECIIIENGSTDNTLNICIKMEETYSSIKVYHCMDKSVSLARNLGLSKATGEIIGFCDADDYMEPHAIKNVVEEFKKTPDLLCVIGGFYTSTSSASSSIKIYRGLNNKILSTQKAMQLIIGNDLVMGSMWNKYYRAFAFKNMTFASELTYCEDTHFNIMVMSHFPQYNVALINSPLYCYVDNPHSVTHQIDKLFDAKNELKYITALKKIQQDCSLSRQTAAQLRMKIACFSIDTLNTLHINAIQKQKLINELNNNFLYLVGNVWKNDWKANVKRILRGLKIMILELKHCKNKG